jgi:hypothetical protein
MAALSILHLQPRKRRFSCSPSPYLQFPRQILFSRGFAHLPQERTFLQIRLAHIAYYTPHLEREWSRMSNHIAPLMEVSIYYMFTILYYTGTCSPDIASELS